MLNHQYLQAWGDFEVRYMNIVGKWLTELVKERTVFNRGPIENNTLISFEQERKFYLLILGELLKDTFQISKEITDISMLVDNKVENSFNLKAMDLTMPSLLDKHQLKNTSQLIPILEILSTNSSLELATYANKISESQQAIASSFNIINKHAGRANFKNFKFQNAISDKFLKLSELVKRIALATETKGNFIFGTTTVSYSDVSNKDLENAFQVITEELKLIDDLFNSQRLTDYQKNIKDTTLKALLAVATELKSIGNIALTGSYRKSEDGGFVTPVCLPFTKSQNATMSQFAKPESCKK
jgi:hypothetical protein